MLELFNYIQYLITEHGLVEVTRSATGDDRSAPDVRAKLTAKGEEALFRLDSWAGSRSSAQQGRELKIMFLAANPISTSRLDLDAELRGVELELRAVAFREYISLVAHHAVRPDDLVRHVRAEQPVVLHFSGHGSKEGIVLRLDAGGPQMVSGQGLEQFLRGRGVELVVLCGCFTDRQAPEINRAVRSVVGTSAAISDEAAKVFSCSFYRSLGNGLTIREAFRDGADAVRLYGLGEIFTAEGDLDRALVGS